MTELYPYTVELPKFDEQCRKDRLYGVWRGMLARCYYPPGKFYYRYGGRGISVCDEWLHSFEAFKEWALANGYDYDAPRGQCTIDRIDNDGNYEPDNCRWVTLQENLKNRSSAGRRPKNPNESDDGREAKAKSSSRSDVIYWEIDGVTKKAVDWCEEYGISYSSVTYRMKHKNMSLKEALTAEKVNYYALKYKYSHSKKRRVC